MYTKWSTCVVRRQWMDQWMGRWMWLCVWARLCSRGRTHPALVGVGEGLGVGDLAAVHVIDHVELMGLGQRRQVLIRKVRGSIGEMVTQRNAERRVVSSCCPQSMSHYPSSIHGRVPVRFIGLHRGWCGPRPRTWPSRCAPRRPPGVVRMDGVANGSSFVHTYGDARPTVPYNSPPPLPHLRLPGQGAVGRLAAVEEGDVVALLC